VSARATGRGDDAVIVSPVTVPYVKHSPHRPHWFIAQALAGLLQQTGLRKDEIDGLVLSSQTLAPDKAIGVTEHLGLSLRYLDDICVGGASGVVALRRALRAVQTGDADVVACIGADTNRPGSFRDTVSEFSLFSRDAVYPYAAGGPNASIALVTAHYMRTWGATRADLGKMCVAQRQNALRYPHALFKKPMTLEDYLSARPIAAPIHLLDCVMPCAGAEAFLVVRRDHAARLGIPRVDVLSSCERHNAFPDDPIQFRSGWALDSDRLFADAGLGPRDIDFVQTYDDYPVMSVIQLEDLGFCAKGEGPDFLRRHDFTTDGSFPLNTCGGQLSVGQAGFAGGFLGIVEAARQLSGRNLARPVTNARHGIVCGFGMITYDRGLCSAAAVFARGRA
jgi:acetyl-CoA acetyltransferase